MEWVVERHWERDIEKVQDLKKPPRNWVREADLRMRNKMIQPRFCRSHTFSFGTSIVNFIFFDSAVWSGTPFFYPLLFIRFTLCLFTSNFSFVDFHRQRSHSLSLSLFLSLFMFIILNIRCVSYIHTNIVDSFSCGFFCFLPFADIFLAYVFAIECAAVILTSNFSFFILIIVITIIYFLSFIFEAKDFISAEWRERVAEQTISAYEKFDGKKKECCSNVLLVVELLPYRATIISMQFLTWFLYSMSPSTMSTGQHSHTHPPSSFFSFYLATIYIFFSVVTSTHELFNAFIVRFIFFPFLVCI